jgi:hypothetical protein
MSLKKIYPTCFKDFSHWILSKPIYNDFYQSLGQPKPFDVTLRDGLQGLTKEEQKDYTFEKKINLYKEILLNHNPKNFEIYTKTSG